MLSRIRKNDNVIVISGRDKGKQGTIITVNPKKGKVLVKGVGVVTKHVKAKKQGEKSRIVKEEGPMNLSKIMPVCPSCKKPCRVSTKVLDDGKKVRSCSRCKESF